MTDYQNTDRKLELLAILKEHLARGEDTRRVLDRKAQIFLGSSSVILSLVGTLQILNVPVPWPLESVITFSIVLAVYLAQVTVSILGLFPRDFSYPVQPEWDNVMSYVPLSDDEYVDQLISDYIKDVDLNNKTNLKKARFVQWAGILQGTMVIAILIAFAIATNFF